MLRKTGVRLPGLALCLLVVHGFSRAPLLEAAASSTDLCQGLVQDTQPHAMTALAKPALGQAVTDPQFGTRIRRITAVTASGPNPAIKPMYSTISAWNADESRLILYNVATGAHELYDGRTYAFIRTLDINPADIEQVYWHTSDPDVLFYVDGRSLIRYHVGGGSKEALRSFDFCSGGASGGADPMFMSWDSNVIGLGCDALVFLYRIDTDTVTGMKTSTRLPPQAAPTGTLAFSNGDVVDPQLNVLRTLDLANPEEHASLGQLANGHDTYNAVAYDPGPRGSDVGSLVTHDMTTGVATVVVGPATGYPYPYNTHVSALAYRQPGWVLLSSDGTTGQAVLEGELVLADTNTGRVCRAAHHRTWGKDNTHLAEPYWAEAHGVPSPSGTRIVFGSDWGNGSTVDTYVLELPSYGSGDSGTTAEVSVAMTDGPDPVVLGDDVTYTILIKNNGPATASQVMVTDTLPPGMAFVSSNPAAPTCSVSGSVVTCSLASLSAGSSAGVTIVASPSSAGSYVNEVHVTSMETDPDSGNNAAVVTTAAYPSLSIGDVSVTEGNSGTVSALFVVSLSAASAQTVAVDYATEDGSAMAGSDYAAASGTLSFAPGTTTATIAVPVLGDTLRETSETFLVDLNGPVGAILTDGQGRGTILDDDRPRRSKR